MGGEGPPSANSRDLKNFLGAMKILVTVSPKKINCGFAQPMVACAGIRARGFWAQQWGRVRACPAWPEQLGPIVSWFVLKFFWGRVRACPARLDQLGPIVSLNKNGSKIFFMEQKCFVRVQNLRDLKKKFERNENFESGPKPKSKSESKFKSDSSSGSLGLC